MHSIWTRLNAFVTLALSVFLVMCCAVAATDLLADASGARVDAGVLGVEKLVQGRGGQDEAILNFWVDLDLTEAFSWNTKQLFTYVSVRYVDDSAGRGDGEEPLRSEVVVWDKIVVPLDAVVKQPRVRNKYKLSGRGPELIGKPFELVVGWSVMPKCGYMYQGSKVFSSPDWVMPSNYTPPNPASATPPNMHPTHP